MARESIAMREKRYQQVRHNIEYLMVSRGKTKQQVSDYLCISRNSLARKLKFPQTLTLDDIFRVACLFNVSICFITDGEVRYNQEARKEG